MWGFPYRDRLFHWEVLRVAQRGRPAKGAHGVIQLDFGTPNPKQKKFLSSTCRYTAYGGARGGGKSWAVRAKGSAGALNYPGIKILMLRRTYPELESTIISPLIEFLNTAKLDGKPAGDKLFTYNATMRTLYFTNGSVIKFGHLQSPNAIHEYQGQEYDWIFMDEATHFTEWEFRTLAATLRGVNKIPKRFYLTCNPGGVGHLWVKRLFVERDYKPEEKPKDYVFIPATVEDNTVLMENSPDYIQMLDLLPDDIRAAHRYGDWDAMAGQFFPEFTRKTHVVKPFPVPDEWPRYRAIDYGLDMFACLWVAVDFDGRAWVYREAQQSGLIVSDAAALMRSLTLPGERIQYTIAPPDLWSTQKDTGRTMAEVYAQNGVGLVKASNSRVQGWLTLKEYLKPGRDGRPMLLVSEDCPCLIRNLPSLQHSEKNPSDCATEPHDITHICDAARYFVQFRTLGAIRPQARDEDDEDDERQDYDEAMCGGEPDDSYLLC
jgi:phage terminase large subunit